MRVLWNLTEDSASYAAAVDPRTGRLCRLIVEQLPNSSKWDWIVWRQGATDEASPSGVAISAMTARAAAEDTIETVRGLP
jgi:hypothetical protein